MAYTTTAGSAEYVSSGPGGVRSLYTTKRKYSLSDRIVYQDRHKNKIHAMLREKISRVTVDDPEPKTLTKQETPRTYTCKSDGTTTTVDEDTLRISDTMAKWLQSGDKLEVANVFCDTDGANYTTTKFGSGYKNETMIIYGVTLSGAASGVANVLVRRANGHSPTSSVQTILTEYKLLHIGNALEDGGSAPDPKWAEPTDEQNYCQMFSVTWGETECESNTNVYGKEDMAVKGARKRLELMERVDYAFLWGTKKKDTYNGQTRWWTGGMVEFVPAAATALDGLTRFIDFGGAYDRDILREKAEIIYAYGSEVKDWFIGSKLWTVMMNSDEKFLVMNDNLSRQFGWQVYEYDLGHGLARIHNHFSFRDKDSTTTPYAYDAAIIDMEYVDLQVMKNMDFKVKTGVQENDAHIQVNELYGQVGLYRSFPTAHAYIYGITG
jgi:hypothetical protein